MSFAEAALLSALVAVVAKTGAWLWQLRSRNAGMVDAIWAWTLGGLAGLYALCGDAPPALRILIAVMGGGWGLRLGWHLWVRNHGKPEDWRYAQLRQQWGAGANAKMFWFFQFQNVFTLMLAASAFAPAVYRDTMPPVWAIALALLLWFGSIAGEGIADRQMERFRANPANKGTVCRDGLWRYSRHPNYFFECVHWAAYLPLALGAPWGWASLAAPVIMAFLLLKLSGVPMLEAEMIRRKPGYDEYVRRTSALIPWPPKA
jgi:steroid 5-alpha reductase family enzyme